jgi:hypothetical protein
MTLKLGIRDFYVKQQMSHNSPMTVIPCAFSCVISNVIGHHVFGEKTYQNAATQCTAAWQQSIIYLCVFLTLMGVRIVGAGSTTWLWR